MRSSRPASTSTSSGSADRSVFFMPPPRPASKPPHPSLSLAHYVTHQEVPAPPEESELRYQCGGQLRAGFGEAIERAYTRSCGLLLDLLRKENNLLQCLSSIKHYFLLYKVRPADQHSSRPGRAPCVVRLTSTVCGAWWCAVSSSGRLLRALHERGRDRPPAGRQVGASASSQHQTHKLVWRCQLLTPVLSARLAACCRPSSSARCRSLAWRACCTCPSRCRPPPPPTATRTTSPAPSHGTTTDQPLPPPAQT